MTMETLRFALGGVAAYRHILETPELHLVRSLLDKLARQDSAGAAEDYAALFYALRAGNYSGLGDWLHDQLRYTESPYARLAEEGGSDPALEGAARRDVELFTQLCKLDCGRLISAMAEQAGAALLPVLEGLPRWPAGCPFTFEELTDFYRTHGSGLFARSRAFLWEDGELFPVDQPDCPTPDEMMGYELQRDQVIANTQALLEGHHVNNVLLFGDSGTGKSATVKSLLSRPGFEDLRLIEVQKEGLADMPRLIRTLGGRRLKFILFIDDLAFDQDDTTYSVMKTILEGGLERRPANVAIYATSNRRHLVRQTFSDRAGDEVDASETIQEKTSLAERFGLRIAYLTMNKVSYLALVEHLAKQAGIEMEKSELHAKAMTWEIRHAGRTPRVARQFIASLHI